MGKCTICGAEVENGSELCESCRHDMDSVEEQEFDFSELEDFNLEDIELPELDGELNEIDLEFKLEDPDNDLENPNIFVHDFQMEDKSIDDNAETMQIDEFENKDQDDVVGNEPQDLEVLGDFSKEDDGTDMLEELLDVPDEMSESVGDDLTSMLDLENLESQDTESNDDLESMLEDSVGVEDLEGLLSEGMQDAETSEDTLSFVNDLLDGIGSDPQDNTGQSSEASEEMDDLLGMLEGIGSDSTEVESSISNNDVAMGSDIILDDLPDEEEIAQVKEKKPSIWKRLFGNIKDEKWEKQKEKEEKQEQERKDKIAAKKEAAEKLEEGVSGEAKIDPKEAKKAEKLAKKEEKARLKEERKIEKQRWKELAELEAANEGRINRVGAAIVFVFMGVFAVIVILGTDKFHYNSSVNQAEAYFQEDKYNAAYDAVWGLEMKEEDAPLFDKIQMVMYLNKQWNSYENYTEIRMYPEALDSLLKGIEKYDAHIDDAKELEVSEDYKKIRQEIMGKLKEEYGLSEKEAYRLIDMEDQEAYSKKVITIANAL
ncbi:MAG: hypothetical protein II992_01480 [Lachnospiraceae bacterium]|nr:hypothetical protein [Lachnospiraceae bacterium]